MAVTIQELIAKREAIQEKKSRLYDVETSIGTITVKIPSSTIVAEAYDFPSTYDGNCYLIYNSIVEPNLRDGELQKAYGVGDPLDIVSRLFQAGEINKLSGKLLDLAGFKNKLATKLHEQVKN